MAEIKCMVVTPEETAVEQMCVFIALPLYDGEKGVGADHAPMIGRLGNGELRLRTSEGQVNRYFVEGGFVQIAENEVSIMTSRAIPSTKLDAESIRSTLTSSQAEKTSSWEDLEAKEKAVDLARAQLRLAEKTAN